MRWGGGGTPSIVEPGGDINIPSPEPKVEPEEELGEVIAFSDAISSTVAMKNYIENNFDLEVTPDSPDYRGNELPSDYTQVEFLLSTGSQYIDTGYMITANSKIEITLLPLKSADADFFGSYPGVSFGQKGTNYLYGYGRGSSPNNDVPIDFSQKTTVTVQGNTWTFDGVTKTAANAIAKQTNILIFCDSYWGSPGWGSSMKLYSFKIENAGSLVRDFIPCYDSSKEFGLYDVVGGQFYTNQGSGTFNSDLTYLYSISGSGTESNPYQIGNFYDLEHIRKIVNYNSGKHYVLTNDIVFNDGQFVLNEDTGNVEYHEGSSGELKIWSSIFFDTFSNCTFDGQGHKIKGFFGVGLFMANYNCNMTNCKFINWHFENGYCNSKAGDQSHHAFFTNYASGCLFENCSTDGFVGGADGSCGFVRNANDTSFINCTNYAKNVAPYYWVSYHSGIVGAATNCLIQGCKNFGDYTKSNNNDAGICYKATNVVIENCENHGKTVAGICFGGDAATTIKNCINHGNCSSGIAYGDVNYGRAGVVGLIENCENHGACSTGIGRAKKIVNCKNYKMPASGGTGIGSATRIENCVNYANVENGSGSFCGISSDGSTEIVNCINYGNARVTRRKASGIGGATKIINCVNYGNIIGSEGENKGIGNGKVVNCVNYGNISGGRYNAGIGSSNCINCENHGNVSGSNAAGIVSFEGKTFIYGCKNYGNITGSGAGTIIGGIYNGDRCEIIDCYATGGVTAVAWPYMTSADKKCEIVIRNCQFEFEQNTINQNCLLVGGTNYKGGGISVEASNIEISIGNLNLPLINDSYDVKIKNILVRTTGNHSTDLLKKTKSQEVNGVIFLRNGNPLKYYGDNFDGFFVKWKTGYVGLKALESAGVYMFAIPDEEYLQQIGYTKAG